MALVTGIDIGSLTAKIVILSSKNNQIQQLYSHIQHVGYNPSGVAIKLINLAKEALEIQKFEFIVATGYGRKLVQQANKKVTEITCHARGAFFINPVIRTVIDIGGQDSKAIRIDESGRNVQDFEMNDKCSAGTGRFLEVIANALGVTTLSEFGNLALNSTNPAVISNTCTVFAESEVISRLNQGANRTDIIAGIHKSIADKITTLTSRVGVLPTVALTGGVALNPGVKVMLEQRLNVPIEIPTEPQMVGALGAALLALKYL
jgi:predicted CoA-substrate-specific enzyme activase